MNSFIVSRTYHRWSVLSSPVPFHSSGCEDSPQVLGLCRNPNWRLPAEEERGGGPVYHEINSGKRLGSTVQSVVFYGA